MAQQKAAKGKPASRKKTTTRTRTTPKRAARTTAKTTPKRAARTTAKTAAKPAARRPVEPRRIPIEDDPQPRRNRIPLGDETPPRAEQEPKHSPFQPGFSPECMACPICMLFYVVKNTKPEAMEHLMKAAFELMQVGKVVFEQYTERFEQAEKLQRINIS